MQIKEVTVEQLKNLGNYESARLTTSALLDENDDINKIVDDLKFYVNYKLNEEERSHIFTKFSAELESKVDEKGKELTEFALNQRKTWIGHYKEATERFNSLEFING